MDLDHSILDMIDEYVSEALSETGTRKAKTGPVMVAVSGPSDDDDLIPIVVELESPNAFATEEETAWMVPPFVPTPDPLPTLSRVRAARGSTPPQDVETEVDLDDEITNLVGKPTR